MAKKPAETLESLRGEIATMGFDVARLPHLNTPAKARKFIKDRRADEEYQAAKMKFVAGSPW